VDSLRSVAYKDNSPSEYFCAIFVAYLNQVPVFGVIRRITETSAL